MILDAENSRFKSKSQTIYLLVLLSTLVYRISVGVDFTDESYYACFLDAWIKMGISHSPNLMLHQTAAFILYPFAYFYQLIMHSEAGMFIYLRFLYLCTSFLSALSFYHLMKKINTQPIALLSFGFILLFIPWSLPALSYNTIAMYSLVAALSLLAIWCINKMDGKNNTNILILSAFLWSLTILSYPTLILGFFSTVVLSLYLIRDQAGIKFIFIYVFTGLLFFAGELCLLFQALGVEHLIAALKFTNAVNHVSDGFLRKLNNTVSLFQQNKFFSFLALYSILIGFLRAFVQFGRITYLLTSIYFLLLFYFAFFCNPVLVLRTHDLIFLLSLLGIYLPLEMIKDKPSSRVPAFVYCASMVTGLITVITAYNSLYNFPIGGLIAASLSISQFSQINRLPINYKNLWGSILLLICQIILAVTAFQFIYGEIFGNPLLVPSSRIKHGIYAGLLTSSTQVRIIEKLMELLPQTPSKETIFVIGRSNAAYLLTSLHPKALTSWGTMNDLNLDSFMKKYYADDKNKPDMLLSYIDPWTLTPQATEENLLKLYQPSRSLELASIRLTLYKKRIPTGS